jgi:type III restriction enzyme
MLFPQVFSFVQQYVQNKVDFNGQDKRELGLQKYTMLMVERLRENIHPDSSAGEPPLLPVLDRYRPVGTTSGVDFTTLRPILSTKRSHLNAVVLDSDWEAAAVRLLDSDEAEGDLNYRPDFLVRLVNELTLLLEIKGYEVHNPEQTNAKHNAARKWVTAVNNLKEEEGLGKWAFLVCRDLDFLLPSIASLLGKQAPTPTADQARSEALFT